MLQLNRLGIRDELHPELVKDLMEYFPIYNH